MRVGRRQATVLLLVLGGIAAWWIQVQLHFRATAKRDDLEAAVRGVKSDQLSPKLDKTRKSERKETSREAELWRLLLSASVEFYGKVVDENKIPISSAKIVASLVDHIGQGDTVVNTITDANGLFHISGHGMAIVIEASKEGYYRDKASVGHFSYSDIGGDVERHTDSDDPAVFVLRKRGKGKKLIQAMRSVRFSRDGAPSSVNISDGRLSEAGKAIIVIEVRTDDRDVKPNSNRPYDWHCRVTVPDGGLLRRIGAYDFTAPENGYLPYDEIDMPVSLGEKWRNNAEKQYFVKFPNGCYARLELNVIPFGDHFWVITSFLNPILGSRNLENDSE